MGTFKSNGVYVKSPMTFDCNNSQRFSVTLQISFVEKFKMFYRKSLRFLAVKVLYLTIYVTCKV